MRRQLAEIENVLLQLLDPPELSEVADRDGDGFYRDDREDCVYVTFELPGRLGPDIDISFHESVCLIRIQR